MASSKNTSWVRLIGITVCVIAVLYLVKTWFFPTQRGQDTSPSSNYSSTPLKKASGVIDWRDAVKHYGEYATVEGTIVATHNSGKACFLNFHPNWKKYFTAVIFASAFSRFPANPENFYYGKKVRVSGDIKEYQGKPEIILNSPDQIEIVE